MTCLQLYSMLERVADNIVGTLDSLVLPNNPIVVYDVDNTLIDNNGRPLVPIIQTYNYVKSKGINTAIVTARVGTSENVEYTRQQLSHHGINGYLYMYFRPVHNIGDAAGQHYFKFKSRKNIHERGHTVVMSVGDMPWDIGEYGGYGIRVPTCKCF